MSKPDRALYDMARRVITSHAAAAGGHAAGMERAYGALYGTLETTMGPAGLEALLSRALHLSAREHPWLSPVRPGFASDSPLSDLAEAAGMVDEQEAVEGSAALLAHLLWLLTTFIGEDLMMRFVRHAWPNVTIARLEVQRND